jgi:hypothetical protein
VAEAGEVCTVPALQSLPDRQVDSLGEVVLVPAAHCTQRRSEEGEGEFAT